MFLNQYLAQVGHCNAPVKHKTETGFALGTWLTRLRVVYNKGELSQEKIKQLDAIGMIWDVFEFDWNQAIMHLEKFKEEFGHCNVPQRYKNNADFPLGYWLGSRKNEHKNNRLSLKRVSQLDLMGIKWA